MVVKLLNALIAEACDLKASDIHIDPTEQGLRVRLRIDGALRDTQDLPPNIGDEIISRIKILASLRTDEHQAAQDGRFRLSLSRTKTIDIRVSIVPTYYGENAVLRLLADQAENFTLEALGFNAENRDKIIQSTARGGMILATGPTGSGKTTTLYTLLKILNTPEVSIVTIEDPIEYAIPGIEQIQVNERTSLNFSSGLRSILRQDPDIIMVGEIRDLETAGIAINTALTGHLLLSTLHTSDAATTLPRLLDMKIEPFLVASTVSLVLSQRLVRRVCQNCREQTQLGSGEWASTISKGRGCEECKQSGYRGRISINEVLVVNDEIREAILAKVPASELKKLAASQGMATITEDGRRKIIEGLTTPEEVLRVAHD
ncbi:MAG: GspE/PulE family protein [Patescibacteria group bacterium]|nr:GspE/PulE family protein [Patescibacteria group bacterium]